VTIDAVAAIPSLEEAGRRSSRRGATVVAAAFAVLFVIFGAAYSFTAFFASLEAEFKALRGALSQAFSITLFLYYLIGAVSGPLANRFGARPMALIGTTILGVGLLGAASAQALWHVYVGFALVGIGVGFAYVPSIGAVQRWFVVRRGFVSGLAVSGIGAGTLAVPLIATALISELDWRGAWIVLGSFTILVGTAAAWFIDDSPERHGMLPDGGVIGVASTSVHAHAASASLSVREALRTREFWLLYFALQCYSVGLFVPFVHLVPFAEDHGIRHDVAVALFSVIGVGSTLGRLCLGGIADKIGRRLSLLGMHLGVALMLTWWLFSATTWQLAVFAFVYGAFYGGAVALTPALVSDYFGSRNASGIIGVLYTAIAFGTLVGPRLAGDAFDYFKNYTLPIAICAGFAFASLVFLAMLREPGRIGPQAAAAGDDGNAKVA
jgi:MFS family permease